MAAAEQDKFESPMPDPPRCGNCTAYRWHRNPQSGKGCGRCHALPPDALANGVFTSDAAWPVVDGDVGWCRMHELKEP